MGPTEFLNGAGRPMISAIAPFAWSRRVCRSCVAAIALCSGTGMGLWRALSELNEPAWDSRLVRCFGPSERPPKIAEGAFIPNRDAERAAAESGGELSAQLIDHLKKSTWQTRPSVFSMVPVGRSRCAWLKLPQRRPPGCRLRKPAYRAVYRAGPNSTAHGDNPHGQVTLRLHRLFVRDRRAN